MYTQGLVYLPDWLEGGLRKDVVGVFGLVDENRNHDGADLLAFGFADYTSDRLNDVDHRALGINKGHAIEHRNIDPFTQARAVGEDATRVVRKVAQAFQSAEGGWLVGWQSFDRRSVSSAHE